MGVPGELQKLYRYKKAVSMKNILILCTGNSCRSQMAEGIARKLFGDRAHIYSAGTKPSSVHSLAIEVMAELGVDLTTHQSKSVDTLTSIPMDLVITVCDNAKESCPVFLGAAKKLHWSFPDPAEVVGTPEAIKSQFRAIREAIYQKFESELGAWL